jgi:HEAT repeat protein
MIILKDIGAETVPLLRPLLTDKDDDIRKFAIDIICETKKCDYPEALSGILKNDPNPNVRASAAKALGILNYREALPELLNALEDEEWVCFSALESLGMMKEESSIRQITYLLDAPSDAIRYAAIEALGDIGSQLAADSLISHFEKAKDFEKTAIVKSLVLLGVTPSIGMYDSLMDMFENGGLNDKLIALKGITALKEKKAISKVVDIAGSLDPSESENEDIIFAVKDAIKSFGCIDELIDIVASASIKFRGKVIAIDVVGGLKCKKAIPHLIKLLETDVRDVRRASIKALCEIKDRNATPTLIDALNDYDGHIRRIAVSALGRIGDKAAFEPIANLLSQEKYEDVIEEAVKALFMLDSERFLSQIENFDSHIKEIAGRLHKM